MTCIIAVDVMSGDHGASVTLPACVLFLKKSKDTICHLFGDSGIIQPWFDKLSLDLQKRVVFFHAPEYIDNNTSPLDAVRKYKNSSMRLAITSLHKGSTHAIVSAGNTGALMALSKVILSTLPGIDRPAIAKQLPVLKGTSKKTVIMLDLGANAQCTPKNLLDFGVLGLALHRSLAPSSIDTDLKILNIGSEHIKGNPLIQQSAALLTEANLPFTGFIEADAIFKGVCDVIVCDGFSGNIALKTAEGTAKAFFYRIKKTLSANFLSSIASWFLQDTLSKELEAFQPSQYNGACILGLKGIVVKSHGNASVKAMSNAIYFAMQQVKQNAMLNIEEALESLKEQKSPPNS